MQTFEIYGNNVDQLPQLLQPSIAKIMKLRTVTKALLFIENQQNTHLVILFSHKKITPKCTAILSKINNDLFGLSKMDYHPDNKKMTLSLVTKKLLLN
jgi:hypothetical protein